jgi:uncharacterized membrane protein YoaK (UPF0700 family)
VLTLAAFTNHLGVFAVALGVAFCGGVYGHVINSRALVLTAIVVIGAISIAFVIAGIPHLGTGRY